MLLLSYLEGKVLEEVSRAVVLVVLGAGAGINPHADGRGLSPWRVLGGNLMENVRTCPARSIGPQLGSPGDDGTHGQTVLQGCGLRLADGRRGGEAAAERRSGRQTGTALQGLRDIQSESAGRHGGGLGG